MKKTPLALLAAVATLALAACTEPPAQPAQKAAPPATTAKAQAPAQTPAALPGAAQGKVTETMDSGGYTYVHVNTGAKEIWAAAPQFPVKVGDEVTVDTSMPMSNYHSKTLDRTFDVLYFCAAIQVAGAPASPASQKPMASSAPAPSVDLKGIQKAEGGVTVGELFAGKASLAGKEVTIRGKVVKYNGGIMGKNWLHLRDGTGAAGSNDLTVTTDATAAVGDTVLVRGVPVLDKDFGYGYKYALIIENAKVTVQ